MSAKQVWASSFNNDGQKPKNAWDGTDDNKATTGFFQSAQEDNPWLRIQLTRCTRITSITIGNKLNCCGERLADIEIRAGLKNDLTNPVVALFQGPGETGEKYVIRLEKPVGNAEYLTFQRKKENSYLQINGIKLNERDAPSKYTLSYQ